MSSTADPRPRPPQEDVAVGRRRRRRRPWLIALAVVLVALLAVGIAAAVYVGGIARIIDQDTQRFDGGAFPAESGRPGAAGASAQQPTAPPPGMDADQAAEGAQGPVAPGADE
ncbi:MAG TPA: transcriptional regulator, partial [Micrococcus luteus]|nr:transcriptional regulator [Micrococcus luteus]